MKSIALQLCCLVTLSLAAAGSSQAQVPAGFDAEIQQGNTQLQAGSADSALDSADAAIRIDPDRWDGYALSGRALLALKRYEAAADALSKAIDRAPGGEEQAELRELRRQCLLAESGVNVGGAAAAPAPAPAPAAASSVGGGASASSAPAAATTQAPVAAAPVQAAPAATAPVQAASAPPPSRKARRRKGQPALYLDPADAGWTDADAGLMWAKPWYYPVGAAGPWSYRDSVAFCSSLRLLGDADWRLPTIDELQKMYLVSSKAWRWSAPKFDPDSGFDEAMKTGLWKQTDFTIDGDSFNGNRLLLWSSTPGDDDGQHAAVYFGRRYSVDDGTKSGVSFPGESRRNPFHGYVICVRNAH